MSVEPKNGAKAARQYIQPQLPLTRLPPFSFLIPFLKSLFLTYCEIPRRRQEKTESRDRHLVFIGSKARLTECNTAYFVAS